MRRGELYRFRDPSGVSGTGVVAQLCEFTDGTIAMRWFGEYAATTIWKDVESLLMIHGHLGAFEVRWFDPDPFETGEGEDAAELATCLSGAAESGP